MTQADGPLPRGSAEAKLVALIARPDGWQRHFHKRTRRILSGAVPGARGGSFLMPSERTRAERPVMDAELTDRAPFPQLPRPIRSARALSD